MSSTSTVSRMMNAYAVLLTEGSCRDEEMKTFLETRHLTSSAGLSEHVTRITSRIQYDSHTNKLIGFVLSFDDH